MRDFLSLLTLLLLLSANLFGNEPDSFFVNSIIEDGFLCQGLSTTEEYCSCLTNNLPLITITRAESQKGKFETINGSLIFYEFYPVTIEIGDYSWTILRYEDNNSRGWYRLDGYRENDFYHFYHRVLHNYLKKDRRIRKLVDDWVKSSPAMSNIEWTCLFENVKKSHVALSCMTANVFSLKARGVYSSGGENSLREVLKSQGYSNLSPYVSRRLYQGTYPSSPAQ